jgi:deoxyribose-phosphate aldolase
MDESRIEVAESLDSPVETYEALAGLIDLVMLRPDLSTDELAEGCRIAREYSVRAVIVRPCDVEMAVRWMEDSGVTVGAAVGYPYGYSTTGAKLFEGRDLLRLGARELDFTLNASAMISRQFQHWRRSFCRS